MAGIERTTHCRHLNGHLIKGFIYSGAEQTLEEPHINQTKRLEQCHRKLQGQQTVSVNIGSEDLLSPTMFGLKCDEKMEYFF